MSRSLIPVALALLAAASIAVPEALAEGGHHHRGVRVHGVCTGQSTSKLKLSREDRGVEVEFQVDQNRNDVPWRVILRRNRTRIASFTATTRAPSGSFEIRRVVRARLGTDRIAAVAIRASGERCSAAASAPRATAAPATSGDDVGDDHGHDSGGHS
jgi:hypothetical protein